MKKIVLTALFFIFALSSCKTVHIPENWLFVESKYDRAAYSDYIRNSGWDESDKDYFTGILEKLVNTDDELLGSRNDGTISRKYFERDGYPKLEYIEFTPARYDKTGFFFLGSGSDVFTIAKELEYLSAVSGSKIYVLNYRGYGKSGGSPSFTTVFGDNSDFTDYIEDAGDKIDFVIGYSLGSVSATYLAGERNIDKLVLMAPLSDAEQAFTHMKRQYTPGWQAVLRPFIKVSADDHLTNISNSDKLGEYNGDLLIIHGDADETLPYKMGKNLYGASSSENKRLITIEGGGHTAPFEDEYLEKIAEFLK